MGLQLGMKEASDIILRAINMVSDNLDTHLYHKYSTPGHQGFYTEIDDLDVASKLEKISSDYNSEDHVFNLNIPYEYFNDDPLNIDSSLAISPTDHLEVKAEIRCMDIITKTYNQWILTHGLFTTKDLMKVINQALDKLRMLRHLDLYVAGNKKEIAEKYIELWLTENHIPYNQGSFTDRFFPVEFHLRDYYDDIGNNTVDGLLGETKLRGKSREQICLLRIAYTIYLEYIGFIKNKYPNIYADYISGKF